MDQITMANDPFPIERPRLLGLAYRMLGSRADAEDIVQRAHLRWWQRSGNGGDVVALPTLLRQLGVADGGTETTTR